MRSAGSWERSSPVARSRVPFRTVRRNGFASRSVTWATTGCSLAARLMVARSRGSASLARAHLRIALRSASSSQFAASWRIARAVSFARVVPRRPGRVTTGAHRRCAIRGRRHSVGRARARRPVARRSPGRSGRTAQPVESPRARGLPRGTPDLLLASCGPRMAGKSATDRRFDLVFGEPGVEPGGA